eukprot:TRINITY_DN14758_c0_g1_i1.p1 TRINITY_DN14758_c0_g1~~TRINITY_DN14758_c0_g1_i1.p1  ORF type:complete len:228 (-),score=26.51 TRINITY_DN14758_c0_g1_i1:162-815(-)
MFAPCLARAPRPLLSRFNGAPLVRRPSSYASSSRFHACEKRLCAPATTSATQATSYSTSTDPDKKFVRPIPETIIPAPVESPLYTFDQFSQALELPEAEKEPEISDLHVNLRSTWGRKTARVLRLQRLVPGVIQGGGDVRTNPQVPVTLDLLALKREIKRYNPREFIKKKFILVVENDKYPRECVRISRLQLNPLSLDPQAITFVRTSETDNVVLYK